MKPRHLILLLIMAYFTFGGTFTCTAHDGDNTIHTTNNNNNNNNK